MSDPSKKIYCNEIDCQGWPGCPCRTGQFWVEYERNALRQKQSQDVMPTIGALLDGWEQLPNHVIEEIQEEAPSLVKAIDFINRAMEGV